MLVGITGAKRSGKDLFALFVKNQSDNIIILKFAGALKEAILYGCEREYMGLTYTDMDGDGVDRERRYISDLKLASVFDYANEYLGITEWNFNTLLSYLSSEKAAIALSRETLEPIKKFSIREALQLYGTEIVRKYRPNFWVEEVERRYLEALASNPDIIALVTDTRFDNEANLIRNYSKKLFRIVRNDAILSSVHASEKGLSDYSDSLLIDNNGSITDLQTQAKEAYNILTQGK